MSLQNDALVILKKEGMIVIILVSKKKKNYYNYLKNTYINFRDEGRGVETSMMKENR